MRSGRAEDGALREVLPQRLGDDGVSFARVVHVLWSLEARAQHDGVVRAGRRAEGRPRVDALRRRAGTVLVKRPGDLGRPLRVIGQVHEDEARTGSLRHLPHLAEDLFCAILTALVGEGREVPHLAEQPRYGV